MNRRNCANLYTIAAMAVAARPASIARADVVLLRGSAIALEGCEVQSVKGGVVSFIAPGGRRMQQPFDEVAAIAFDGLPELDNAEAAMLDEDLQRAIGWFVLALADARDDVQRQWVHVRLAKAHNAAGQYTSAAGHAAAVFALDDNPLWKRLAPTCAPDAPAYPAAEEAMHRLQAARRAVRSRELIGLIDELNRAVRTARDAAAEDWSGRRIAPGSTISGYAINELGALRAALAESQGDQGPRGETVNASPAPAAAPAPGNMPASAPGDVPQRDAPVSVSQPAEPAAVGEAGVGADADATAAAAAAHEIESMLADGRYRLALDRCEARLRQSSGEEAARLLAQSGRALRGLDRPREAAVALMRSALLHPDSPVAPDCLLQTAEIYLELDRNPGTAARLAEMARQGAERRRDDIIAARAKALLEQLRGRP